VLLPHGRRTRRVPASVTIPAGQSSATFAFVDAAPSGGTNGAIYNTIALSGTIAANGYLVIAGPSVTVPAPAIKFNPGWTTDTIQNGAPDGNFPAHDRQPTVVEDRRPDRRWREGPALYGPELGVRF
jgi:hypothetical protein